MLKKTIAFLLLIIAFVSIAYSQNKAIVTGTVTDEKKKAG